MNGSLLARLGAWPRVVAASLVLLPLLGGCGTGSYPEQIGVGGGGGPSGPSSGTLIQMVLSPSSITLAPGGSTQFSVSGTLGDGSSTVPRVVYTATRGTITAGGLFVAGATVGVDTVIATEAGGVAGSPPCCADTSVVTVTDNPPTSLFILAEPGGAVSGTAFTQQPVVEILDDLGRPLAQSGVDVTAAIASGTGTLGGTLTVATDAQGRAVFSGLEITGTGSFTLKFTSPGLTSVTSGTVTVTP